MIYKESQQDSKQKLLRVPLHSAILRNYGQKKEVLSKCPVIQYAVWMFTARYGLANVKLNQPGILIWRNCRNKEELIYVLVVENNMIPDKM